MTDEINRFAQAAQTASVLNLLRALVLSKPKSKEIANKIKYSLRTKADDIVLVKESFLPDGKALQKILETNSLENEIAAELANYGQADLLTADGDAEYKLTKKGTPVLLGLDKLVRRMPQSNNLSTNELSPLHRTKKYILNGDELFLQELGITDRSGRIHDKMQPKFRQINRFLEYVSNIVDKLPNGKLTVHDLCCGKSYLSFAVYHYLSNILGRDVEMLGVDLKADVIDYCNKTADNCRFHNLRFICGDILRVDYPSKPDLVISLHACDRATDIVLEHAAANGAKVILSTPCCQHELYEKLDCPKLSFISDYPILKNKFCAVATDALRLKKLESQGYSVKATELTDPDDTPKNVLLIAIKRDNFSPLSPEALKMRGEYTALRKFLTGD